MTGEKAVFDWPTVPRGGAPDSYLSSLSLPGGGGEASVRVCVKPSMSASVFLTGCVLERCRH